MATNNELLEQIRDASGATESVKVVTWADFEDVRDITDDSYPNWSYWLKADDPKTIILDLPNDSPDMPADLGGSVSSSYILIPNDLDVPVGTVFTLISYNWPVKDAGPVVNYLPTSELDWNNATSVVGTGTVSYDYYSADGSPQSGSVGYSGDGQIPPDSSIIIIKDTASSWRTLHVGINPSGPIAQALSDAAAVKALLAGYGGTGILQLRLRSPDGTVWAVGVDDAGTVTAALA